MALFGSRKKGNELFSSVELCSTLVNAKEQLWTFLHLSLLNETNGVPAMTEFTLMRSINHSPSKD